ncbi:MAG TPA: RNA polymerase sigma factor [Chitinophagaceae bacterium]|nr:RNA polymerase sigma factor [Chitinophagaceae bacterium]
MLTALELSEHIEGCIKNQRESQKTIYSSFYGYAMSICDRYSGNYDDAVEILNDGFLKVFKEIHKYQPAYADTIASFKGWVRKIMVYTAIDHYRKIKKHLIGQTDPVALQIASAQETALDKLTYQEILRAVQQLSPAYRTVFNLFVMEGMSHDEISKKLGIAEGTSKSNLAKARMHLQKLLLKQNEQQYKRNAV